MPINFPIDPSAQTPVNEFSPTSYPDKTDNNTIYKWDSIKWVAYIPSLDDLPSVEVGENPPSNPTIGDLWWDSSEDSGRLYVYYDDGNTEQWVDASPDNWDPSAMPDTSDPTQQPGTLDDRYVNIIGDNMTGNLTLGTDKITLNATDGSGRFTGSITSTDKLVAYVDKDVPVNDKILSLNVPVAYAANNFDFIKCSIHLI